MSYNCCSGNFSSRCLGGYLLYPDPSCGFFCPRNLLYSTDLLSPSTFQLGSSLCNGFQEIHRKPIRCQAFHAVTTPCQTSCFHPRTSTLYSPCWATYAGSLGSRPSRGCSLGYGSRSCYSLGCGSSSFRPVACRVRALPSLNH
uniref:Keratin-associated protein n=1 Tax=Catagonus wagneri TaxID=51154 RepID=A0A8C3X3F2_9CETA